MKTDLRHLIDLSKIDSLLEGFNKTTGFVTAILDLEGNVLSKSGWRLICTDFHRVNPQTCARCTISDTVLANKMSEGGKYHFYECLNGLIDVAVPVIINGEHVANLFSGQFFFEKPDINLFKKQSHEFGFDENKYLDALSNVPVVAEEQVRVAMEFLQGMTQFISEQAFQKEELAELSKQLEGSEAKFKSVFESANVGKSVTSLSGEIEANRTFSDMLGYTPEEMSKKHWKDFTPAEDIPFVQSYIDSLLNGKIDSARFEKRYIRKNGSILWADLSVSLRRDNNGKPVFLITTIIDVTEHRAAEKKLRDSEEQYRSLFENMNAGFVLFEVVQDNKGLPIDLLILAANEGFEKTTGLNLKDSIGKRLTNVLPGIEKDQSDWIGTYAKVALTGESIQMEQGSELLGYYYSVSAFQAAYKQCAVSFVDITERKLGEEKLRESEERFRSLYENATVGMYRTTPEGRILMANPSLVSILGYDSFNELAERNLAQEGYESDNEREKFRRIIDIKGKVTGFESGWKSKDGSVVFMRESARAFKDSEGNVIYYEGTVENITEQKLAEGKLHESEAKFKAVFENAPIGISVLDSNYKLLESNDMLNQIVHMSKEGLASGTYRDRKYIRVDGSEIPFNELASTRANVEKKIVRNVVNGIIMEDDEVIWTQVSAAPLSLPNSRIVVITQDITDRKRAEDEIQKLNTQLEELNADLELKVIQRTFELETANRELEAFSYSVSHDLRAPLRHINGYVDLLIREYGEMLDDKAHHYLDVLSGSSRQMGKLIDDLLQFSRTGRKELIKSELDSNALLLEVLEEMKPVLNGRKIDWEISELPKVYGDYALLKLVWTNLIDNAIKYTRNRQETKISVACKTEAKNFVFCISDNGVGFDMKYANKLFGVFQRLHSQNEFEGTGIGLANVQRIIQKHSGLVWAEAEIGKGATFYFSLPKIKPSKND